MVTMSDVKELNRLEMIDINYIHGCNEICRHDLVENIMPFWMKYGVDRVNGGVYTNVDRDGTLMDSTKSVWFQGRFGFICSYLYNNICKKKNGSMPPNRHWNSSKKSASILTGTCSSQ